MTVPTNLCVGFFLLAALGPIAFGATPGERGPFPISEFSESLKDSTRGRTIDLLVFRPAPASDAVLPGGPFPLLVFSHGFLLTGKDYRSYGEHLASHGFVVALPTYTMNLFDVNHATLAEDLRFVIDRCLAENVTAGSALHGLVNPRAIGVAGHSLGGKVSLLEAASDPRVRAAGLLDPVDGTGPVTSDPIRYPSVAPELMPEIRIPLLLVGSELGGVAFLFTACAPKDENYEQFFQAANPPAIEVTQLDVGHSQYVDPGANLLVAASCAQGKVPGDWVRASSAAYLEAFFWWALKEDTTALAWLDSQLAVDESAGRIRVRRK